MGCRHYERVFNRDQRRQAPATSSTSGPGPDSDAVATGDSISTSARTHRPRVRNVGMVAALMASCALGAAYGGSPASAASQRSGGNNPASGGNLTFGEVSAVTNLDPIHTNGGGTSGGDEGGAIYGYLMRYDKSANRFVPSMAKGLTSSDNYTTWTLTLRPGMKFSDGSPFDAAAVVENINREKASHSVAGTSLTLVKSAVATNPTTVVFTLEQPWSGFAYVLAWVPGLIAAPSYIAQVDAGNAQATPIGAGPFEVESFKPGTSLTLTPNPTYGLAKPKLSSLTFTYVPGGPATLQAFQAGQMNAAELIDAPSVQNANRAKIPSMPARFECGTVLLMNNRSTSPLSNPKLRQAVALAFNPKVWNERVNQGVPLASNLIFPKGSVWYTPQEQKLPYNPKKAAQLVSQVKQQTGWNGTLRLLVSTANQNVVVPLEAMLQPIGITLDVTSSVPLTTLETDVIVNHNFDLAQWGIGVGDSQPFFDLWKAFVSPNNYSGYSDMGMTAALNSLGAASTTAQKKAAMQQFISAFISTNPLIDTGVSDQNVIHKQSVHGLYNSIKNTAFFDKAWVS